MHETCNEYYCADCGSNCSNLNYKNIKLVPCQLCLLNFCEDCINKCTNKYTNCSYFECNNHELENIRMKECEKCQEKYCEKCLKEHICN